ncbi:MAG: hypothetical protein ABSH06_15620 [Thermodesulfobacteriota bacterium]
MTNVNGFTVPVEHADVGVSIAANDRALNASQLDGAGEVPVLIYRRDNCGGNGVEVNPLQQQYRSAPFLPPPVILREEDHPCRTLPELSLE